MHTGLMSLEDSAMQEHHPCPLPVSAAEGSVGRVCRERLRLVFVSWVSKREEEPSQLGSSQLLFPDWFMRVGLLGALTARSYI